MIDEIKYNGVTTVPSDYECPDGDLAVASNVVVEEGVIKPVFPPTEIKKFEGYRFLYIHKSDTDTNYILTEDSITNSNLYWASKDSTEPTKIESASISSMPIQGIKKIDSIGNTLIINTKASSMSPGTAGIYFLLWKPDKPGYLYLGDSIPDISLSMGLEGRVRFYSIVRGEDPDNEDEKKGCFEIEFDEIEKDKIHDEFSDDNKRKITSQVMAKVNRFVKEQTTDKGRFCFPFFVRYALRLYDGTTLVNHSAPILMMPSTSVCPVVIWRRIKANGDNYTKAQLDIMLVAASLNFKEVSANRENLKEQWGDIVKSVDFFISAPIYTYDQAGEVKGFYDMDNLDTSFIGKPYVKGLKTYLPDEDMFDDIGIDYNKVDSDLIPILKGDAPLINDLGNIDPNFKPSFEKYYEWSYGHLYAIFLNFYDRKYYGSTLALPEKEPEKLKEEFESVSNFYLLKSYSLDELNKLLEEEDRATITVPDEYLQSLYQRETMVDDYLTHDKAMPTDTFVYNQRLNLSNIKRRLFNGFNPLTMLCYKEGEYIWNPSKTNREDEDNTVVSYLQELYKPQSWGTQYDISSKTFIKEGGENFAVTSGGYNPTPIAYYRSTLVNTATQEIIPRAWGNFLFYPNTSATKMEITDKDFKTCSIDLKPHDFLNGAYAFRGFADKYVPANEDTTTTVSGSNIVHTPNQLWTSEVNNPFYFPVTGVNTIGTGAIMGMSAALQPLSQGQFGEFPLYVFTDEGIWAMSTGNDGTFVARQPLSRDVCICPDSITQVDSAVLFASARGLMILYGNTTKCLSDNLSSDPFDANLLPHLTDVAGNIKTPANIKEYIKNCKIAYDYINQRVYVFNPKEDYSYILSNKSLTWSTANIKIDNVLNGYPDCLVTLPDGTLADIGKPIVSSQLPSVIVTRPMKLKSPNDLKTVRDIIQRGAIQHNDVKQILYGSRDLFNWSAIASSDSKQIRGISGTPYKYYRLAMIADLSQGKSLFGCSINLIPKLGNKLR